MFTGDKVMSGDALAVEVPKGELDREADSKLVILPPLPLPLPRADTDGHSGLLVPLADRVEVGLAVSEPPPAGVALLAGVALAKSEGGVVPEGDSVTTAEADPEGDKGGVPVA